MISSRLARRLIALSSKDYSVVEDELYSDDALTNIEYWVRVRALLRCADILDHTYNKAIYDKWKKEQDRVAKRDAPKQPRRQRLR